MEESKQHAGRLTNGYSIEMAVEVLDQQLKHIPNVKIWAVFMGYSRSYFSSKIKEQFGKTPTELLRDIRIKHIYNQILTHPNETSYGVARLVGLENDDALYKFLSYHFNTNFTELRRSLLNGRQMKDREQSGLKN